jgi:hypothetical protein
MPKFHFVRSNLLRPILILAGLALLAVYGYSRLNTDPTVYYVDCDDGDNQNSGTGPDQAWRTMDKANKAPLQPGDSLLFRRGCTWYLTLNAAWNGTRWLPVTIGAYGEGELPIFKNGTNDNIKITGSYLILEHLHAHTDPLQVDPNCANQPYGYYQTGFHFLQGAAYNTLRYSRASGNTVGVRIGYAAHHIKVFKNTLVNNNVLQILDKEPNNDLGAWGMLVHGSDNEVSYNYFKDNNAWCSYDFGISGNSIEVYAGQRTRIHHNTSINDQNFSELGSRADRRASDNVYAYNLFVSATPNARFVIVRGANDTQWGPTLRTTVVNNTVYLTAPNSAGVVCGAGCNSRILTLRNNILWAEEKPAFASSPFKEDHNLYWSSDGIPFVQFVEYEMSATSDIADPHFIDPANGDFHLFIGSPAIDAGVRTDWKNDLDGVSVPAGNGVDIGAFEFTEAQGNWNERFSPVSLLFAPFSLADDLSSMKP